MTGWEPLISRGSFILADRTAYWNEEPHVGDLIVFEHEGKVLVKRVAAVGGETVLHSGAYIKVPSGCLYVIGDNDRESLDSRDWEQPFIGMDAVIARVILSGN